MESLAFSLPANQGFLGLFWTVRLRKYSSNPITGLACGWMDKVPSTSASFPASQNEKSKYFGDLYLQTQNLNFARFSQKCRKACHKFPYQFRYSFTTVIHGWSQGTTFTFWNKSSCTPTITANPTEFASNSLAFDSPHQACNLLIGTKDDHTWKWKEYILESHTSVTFISFVDGSVRLAWFFVPLSWQKRTL